MSLYKKFVYISGAMILLGIGLIVFGVILTSIISSEASNQAVLSEKTNDLWAYIPGRSKVSLYKNHYFYDIENLEDVFFKNKKPIAKEVGPFIVQEFDEYINRNYSENNDTVFFNLWRYLNYPTEGREDEMKKQENTTMRTINLPSLGVWFQAKNASPSQVALKALYTIYKSLTIDLYYNAIQTAINSLPPVNSTGYLSQFQDTYFSEEFKNQMTFDKDFGLFGANNALFVKAVLTHPSPDSKYLMEYWGLKEVEMHYLKKIFLDAKETAFKTDTYLDMAVKQWLDLSINRGESVASMNKTASGYIEYGAYLANVIKTQKSNLTHEQAQRLFFDFNDIGRTPKIDDSSCLINKKNLDHIFELNETQAIEFINKQMKINNTDESTNIYGYLNYVVNELGIAQSRNGTMAIAAISDFLSQAFYQIFNTMGSDLYYGILTQTLFNDYFSNKTCEEALNTITLPQKYNTSLICKNQQLNTQKYENILFWVNGTLYKSSSFRTTINSTLENTLSDFDYLELTKDNSAIVNFFASFVNTIFVKYKIKGNYKSNYLIPLAVIQWVSGNLTQTNTTFSGKSIKDWQPSHYKTIPEYSQFCQNFGYENKIDFDSILSVANFDNMFSSKWISDVFINYNKSKSKDILDSFKSTNPFFTKEFVDYMRYVFIYEVLVLFTKKSAKDLIWGYEDDLLKLVKGTNYFLGGDPTINPLFSLGNNMTTQPDRDNIWSFYTGINDYMKTRQYKTVLGRNDSVIIMREPYFDGNTVTWKYRNPWRSLVPLNGTDGLSVNPSTKTDDNIWLYLDDLYRTGAFRYNSTKKFLKLNAYRFVLDSNAIKDKYHYPYNEVYYCDKYNGYGNLTSVFKVPMYASKPNYEGCDNSDNEKPQITEVPYTPKESPDDDDVTLYRESWIDIEPNSGAVLRAAQKLLLSALLETDILFENDSRFIPIYNLFRTGNFTEDSVKIVFGDLFTGLTIKFILLILGICLTTLFVALLIFSIIKIKQENNNDHNALLVNN